MDLEDGGVRCDPDNKSNATECIANYVQNKLGCRIPTWESDEKISSKQYVNLRKYFFIKIYISLIFRVSIMQELCPVQRGK